MSPPRSLRPSAGLETFLTEAGRPREHPLHLKRIGRRRRDAVSPTCTFPGSELYGDLVLNTTIPEFSAFKVALACRKPVQMHDPKSAAAESIRRLADELMTRIQQRKQQREAA